MLISEQCSILSFLSYQQINELYFLLCAFCLTYGLFFLVHSLEG